MNGEMASYGVHEKVLNLIDEKSKYILDLASGKGIMSKRLMDLGYKVTSIDINNQSNYSLNFLKANLNKDFPLNNELFDLVVAIEIIEHLENPRHFLREIKRVLKNNGEIIITTPNITHWKARLKFLLTGIHWCFRDIDYFESGHITPIKLRDFENICKELNLKIEKVTYNNSEKNINGIIMILKIKNEQSKRNSNTPNSITLIR